LKGLFKKKFAMLKVLSIFESFPARLGVYYLIYNSDGT